MWDRRWLGAADQAEIHRAAFQLLLSDRGLRSNGKAQPHAVTHNAASVQRIETGIDVATDTAVTYMTRRPLGRPVDSKDTGRSAARGKLFILPTLYHREDLGPERGHDGAQKAAGRR